MTNRHRVTPLGKELRKLRVDHGERLFDMASELGYSSSMLSAIELGRRLPPRNLLSHLIQHYTIPDDLHDTLALAIKTACKDFSLDPQTRDQAETARLLTEQFARLNPGQLEDIRRIVGADSECGTHDGKETPE